MSVSLRCFAGQPVSLSAPKVTPAPKSSPAGSDWNRRHLYASSTETPAHDGRSPWQKEMILGQTPVHPFSMGSDPCFISSLGLTPNFENECTGVGPTSATGC